MLITPRQSPECCKQVIVWRFFVSRNESSDRLLEIWPESGVRQVSGYT